MRKGALKWGPGDVFASGIGSVPIDQVGELLYFLVLVSCRSNLLNCHWGNTDIDKVLAVLHWLNVNIQCLE
ncbi:hypothetical protein SAMD00019534_064880 [Acytostelium subglobosum LB1]|uniref:hypothetical protein n=1 Tax=Acytostelium subglobosum LB1 TaxID=1410327 RepID=UPI00064509FC|nr:hypothetical protein SAMD00019534_064880 [Acytostelium subglobosum LB1]GAM23313.1 hypothetical protein SAMD00019534_064880 [Acytostelium subglobosum LB1]|eukprot:XP_012753762.1 hypothetical protein SAMD00019534_064880 [Acytostelium subglobosum LB1]